MPARGPAEPSLLVVGHVTRAHGTKGEVFVWPLTDEPERLFEPGRWLALGDADGEPGEDRLEIESVRPFKRGFLLRFLGVTDRTVAEARLAGRYVLAARVELVPPAAGELWYHQLIGLRVVTVAGEEVGEVVEVYETEPTHLMEVLAASGRKVLVPAGPPIVHSYDLEAGLLVIDPPVGLLDL